MIGAIGNLSKLNLGSYSNDAISVVVSHATAPTRCPKIFIKAVAAYDVSCLMEYKNLTLQQACEEVVLKKLVALNGDGGLIGMDANGNAALVFNSAGMYRGLKNSEGENLIAIYGS